MITKDSSMSLVVGSEAVVAMHPDEAQEHALNIYIYIYTKKGQMCKHRYLELAM